MERAQGSASRSSLFILGLSLLSLLAFFLRLYRLDWQSLWVDENFTVFLSTQDLASITRITSGDVHPPLYYYIVHYWLLLTGQSEFSLRFLSLVFSLLLVPLTFQTASYLAGRRVGLLAAILTAIAPFQVYYAQEGRMYSLITLLGLVSTYALARLAGYGLVVPAAGRGARGSGFLWAAWALSSAASIYTHYFGLLLLVFQNSVVLLTRLRERGFFLRWCLAQAAVAASLAPWVLVMIRVYVTNEEEWRRHIPLLPMLREIMVSLSVGQSVDEALSLPLAAGFFLALLAGMAALALKKGARQLLLLLALYLFQPILLAYLVSFNKPVYGASRYLIFVAPAFYLLISLGLQSIREKWLPLFLALLAYLAGASGYSLANHYWNEAFAKDDYRGLARLIERKAGPDDGLVVMSGVVFDYYYKGSLPRILLPQQYPLNQGQVLEELNRFSRGKSQLWLVQWKYSGVDPDYFILHTLEEYGEKTDEGSIRGLDYYAFRLPREAPFQVAIGQPLEANFDNRISMVGYTLNPNKVAAGQALDVALHMKTTQRLDQDYKVSLSLVDNQGYRWVQEDKPPTGYSMSRWRVGELVQTRLRLKVPLGIPPGEYSVVMVVYSAANQESLPVLDSHQAPLGTILRLGNIQVERGQLPYNVASVTPSRPLAQDLASEIRLLGYDISPAEVGQGGTLTLVLYWQALSPPAEDYLVSIRLIGEAGNPVQEFGRRPNQGRYPTTEWRQGEIVRDVHIVPVASSASPGRSRVVVSLARPGLTNPPEVELSPVLVKEKTRTFEVPSVERPREADLGGRVRFLGYALEEGSPLGPGDKMALTLYWQAQTDGTDSYVVFTHLLDGQGRIWGQHDGLPASGTQPTSSWVAGQTVTDRHQLAIKADAPVGDYVLEIGMYDPATGLRLKLPNGEDRVLLERVRVQ